MLSRNLELQETRLLQDAKPNGPPLLPFVPEVVLEKFAMIVIQRLVDAEEQVCDMKNGWTGFTLRVLGCVAPLYRANRCTLTSCSPDLQI
jgi:hypothetical protein